MKKLTILSILFLFLTSPALAKTYNLEIAKQEVNITGKIVKKITVNGTIPAPTLYFKEGEEVTINVKNNLKEDTSIHWHGFLLPGQMDGVPGFNGFHGIKPNEIFTYKFKIRQSGTYWYHAHSRLQEQDGLYGAIIIEPKKPEKIKVERDFVILFSDFSNEDADTILRNLKADSEHYNKGKRTIGDFFSDIKKYGFAAAWQNAKNWGEMRMSPTDLADVSGYTFLFNGKTPEQNWTGIFKAGEKVRLRFINASAMSFFDVRIPNLEMLVVSSDGQNVEPIKIDEFRFGPAETYDVIVEPRENKAYTIVAESLDRSGFALGVLAPKEGMKAEIPKHRPRTLLTMADMGHDHATMDHKNHAPRGAPHLVGTPTSMSNEHTGSKMLPNDMVSGWADHGAPEGTRILDYKDLRYLGLQKDQRQPEREIIFTLGGSMERYIWTMNGKTFNNSVPIYLKYGERVRLKFVNETMMAHPMHLHGMFMQLENGQSVAKLPNKHTFIVPPGNLISVLLTADELGEWALHCHLLYHMASGMMMKVVVEK